MNRLVRFLLLLTLAVGCSGEKSVPAWDPSGLALADRSELVLWDYFTDPPIAFTLVLATEARSESELTREARDLIDQLPDHNLVLIFFYREVEEATEDREFTVGKAWWGCNDPWHFPEPGDYSRHLLKITVAEKPVAQ